MSFWKHLLVAGAMVVVGARALTTSAGPGADGGIAAQRALQGSLESLVKEGRIAGAAGLAARDGEVLFRGAAGHACRETGTRMTGRHVFRIASMTKPITSVAAMILYEEGRLSLDAPVAAFLPEFAHPTVLEVGKDGASRLVPALEPVTVRHLLTHTSGLNYRFFAEGPLGRLYDEANVQDGLEPGERSLQQEMKRLAKLPLTHPPGQGWTYGLSTDVLGAVVEVVSGRTLDEFLEERIFAPLGMDDTGFFVPASKVDRLATLYRPGASGRLEPLSGVVQDGRMRFAPNGVAGTKPRYLSGGGGLVSTLDDYFRFAQMIANGGELDGIRLLKPETVALMTSNQIGGLRTSFDHDEYGFGFSITTEARDGIPEGVVGWGGILGTEVWIDPHTGIVAVFLSQVYDFPGRDAIVRRFGGEVFRALATEVSS